MKTQKPDAARVWKQFTDSLIPRYRLSIADRSVYWHLVRLSRLEGAVRVRVSIYSLARDLGLTPNPVRNAIRKLASFGILRILERNRRGHAIEVRLPSEVRSVSPKHLPRQSGNVRSTSFAPHAIPATAGSELEEIDFLQTLSLRETIHALGGGRCFYCLRRLKRRLRCLDHVIPLARRGRNSYRNLVSSCAECNSVKGGGSASNLLRRLYREHRLTSSELAARLRALKSLAAGKLRPSLGKP